VRSSKTNPDPAAQLFAEIYRVVRRIPRGKVATYGQVAELAGLPGGARTVGRAMKLSARASALPWQRVVGKRSHGTAKIAILDAIGGAIQRQLLEKEGVHFSDAGTISLAAHGWLPAPTRHRGPKTKRRDPKAAPRDRKSR
jgi:methylated-DNA-protein-cysteine methyltransferase-like protein